MPEEATVLVSSDVVALDNVDDMVSPVKESGISQETRAAAVRVDVQGKYESKLRENGIPADVLETLLPGDDVIDLQEPVVAGGLTYRFIKRAFDVCSTGIALIFLAIPMGVIALKIKSESPGSVIYAQERVGRNGKPFKVYKFRSMYIDAEVRGAQWAQGDDPRVTPFGRFMRERRMASVIIGTPGDGEPTKSFSHPANSSLDLQKCERRPGTSFGVRPHYTSFQFLSLAVFGGFLKRPEAGFYACAQAPSAVIRAAV